jgi:hypothetical protein
MKYDIRHPAPQANESKYNWKSGPPPHIGWWLTADHRGVHRWCWWNGLDYDYQGERKQAHTLCWSDYYPENARVPRVDPSLPGNRGIVACINASLNDTPQQQFWAGKAWASYDARQTRADAAAAGSTPTVQAMKERMKPAPAALNPAYVPGSRQRLSEAVRAADVDFSGAMRRNTDPEARRRDYRAGDETLWEGKGTPVSNGQAPDPFAGISTMDLMKEVVRRLNV